MKKVERDEILDYVTYEERRAEVRPKVLALKEPRRIHVGGVLTFLFENHETVRYQIQEMVRIEQMVREADIRHEIETYNELLGGPGELGCTLLVEIDDEDERSRLLVEWLDLPAHLYARTDDGEKVRPVFDARQVGDTRLSSVQYLVFPMGGRPPVALGSDLPALTVESGLTPEQHAALADDLT